MRLELFFKTAAELNLLLQNSKTLGIYPYLSKVNLANKAKNERKDLLKSASTILRWSADNDSEQDICLHYSMKNNKAKTVQESVEMFTDFLKQASSISSSSSSRYVREILLCSGGGKEKPKADTIEVLKTLPLSSIPTNISLGVAFNPYEVDIQNENRRLKEKLLYNVDRVYLQFGSDLIKLKEGMEFILELNGERSLDGKDPLKVVGSVMIPSKQLLARFRFRPWAGLMLSEEFLNNIDVADKTVRDLLVIYREYDVEPLLETAINEKNFAYFKDLFDFNEVEFPKNANKVAKTKLSKLENDVMPRKVRKV